MFVFLTVIISAIYVVSLYQRGGISINFNKIMTQIDSDMTLIHKEDKSILEHSAYKTMMIFSFIFHLLFILYFYLAYKSNTVVLSFLLIIITSIFLDIIFEVLFYKLLIKKSFFSETKNFVLSKIATVNFIFQFTTFLYIIKRIFEL